MSSVAEHDAGIASGINTAAFQIGAGVGTAVVSSIIISQTSRSTRPGLLAEGYQAGFLACVALAIVGACAAFVLLKPTARSRPEPPPATEPASRATGQQPSPPARR
jgi:MFS family permease